MRAKIKRRSGLSFIFLFIVVLSGGLLLRQSAARENDTAANFAPAQSCNPNPISIPTSGAASPYPSNITVSGLSGAITNVSVTLNSIQHHFANEVDILLVGPGGQKFVILSDVGSTTGFDIPATITLSDAGAVPIPNAPNGPIVSGIYKPANWGVSTTDFFAPPAPFAPYSHPTDTGSATFASVFNNFDPNGVWSLYVVDDSSGDGGSIAGGWCLDIETTAGQPGRVQLDSSSYFTNAGNTASVTVSRTNGVTGAISVDFSASGGTATGGTACTAGVDYVTPNTSLNFASGETSKTVNIQICPNTVSEPDETVNLVLSNPTGGATVGTPGTAILTITTALAQFCSQTPIRLDNYAQPYPATVNVSGMNGLISDVSVKLVNAQSDFSADLDFLLVSPTGQKFIVMSDVGGSVGLDTAATLTLTDAALPGLPEGNVVISSGNYKPTNFGAGDNGFYAPAPIAPYNEPAPAGNATFASVFNGFQPNGTWSLYLIGDAAGADANISGGWCVGLATNNPNSPGQLQFGTTTYSANEGETANVVVARSGGSSGAVTVDYATASGTATGGAACGNGVDYINRSGTLNFPDGVLSQTIQIQMCLDPITDSGETFNIALSNPTGGATLGANANAGVRILNVDETFLSLFSTQFYTREGTKQTIVLTRSFNQIGTATVDYAVTSGTATGGAACTAGVDFILQSGTLIFTPGAGTRSVNIETCPDAIAETVESVNIQLSNPVNARLENAIAANLFIYESIWKKQVSNPTGRTLEDVQMISANEGWAVGDDGLILHTTDGGATWEHQQSGTYKGLNAVHFVDAQRGAAVGEQEVYTIDGGRNWRLADSSQPSEIVFQIAFADENRGFAVGNNMRFIKKTADGGRNWVVQQLPIKVRFIKFFDALNGLANGSEGVVITVDGGETWTLRPNATEGSEWIDTNRGWRTNNLLITNSQTIDYTTNGGVTWQSGATPAGTYLFTYGLHFVDALNGWGVGTKENIVRTTDGGVTWQTQRGGLNAPRRFNALLLDINMFDAQRGAAVGGGGMIFTTNDGGQNWIPRQNGSDFRVHKIVATDARHAWAGLEGGDILKTVDGGKHWNRQKAYVGSSPNGAMIAGIAFPNQQNGWACIRGNTGTPGVPSVLKTTDSGENWQDVNNAQPHNCWAIDTFDNQTIVSVGFDGGGAPIVRSTDGGQSWTLTRYTGGPVIRDVDMVSGQVGYMAAGSQILKSTNGFASWTTVAVSGSWFDVSFADENNGWALGANGSGVIELWHTSNGGQTWDIKPTPDARGVHAVNASTAWIVENRFDPNNPYQNVASARRTTDGGQTFSPRELLSLETNSDAIFFVDPDNGWVGGLNRQFPSLTIDGADIFRRGTLGLNAGKTPFDFDGDGKADISVFRPSAGEWWMQHSSGGIFALQFGSSTDQIVPGDYTGDGKTDVAVWRPSTGEWFILRSEDSSFYAFPFGTDGDVPAPADYDGDGKTDAAVFRPSNSVWYIQKSSGGVSIQTLRTERRYTRCVRL